MKDVFEVEGINYYVQGVILVLNEAGDTKIFWDRKNEAEMENAREIFDSMIDKGFTAFSVGRQGKKSKKITEFNPKMNKILLVPRIAGGN